MPHKNGVALHIDSIQSSLSDFVAPPHGDSEVRVEVRLFERTPRSTSARGVLGAHTGPRERVWGETLERLVGHEEFAQLSPPRTFQRHLYPQLPATPVTRVFSHVEEGTLEGGWVERRVVAGITLSTGLAGGWPLHANVEGVVETHFPPAPPPIPIRQRNHALDLATRGTSARANGAPPPCALPWCIEGVREKRMTFYDVPGWEIVWSRVAVSRNEPAGGTSNDECCELAIVPARRPGASEGAARLVDRVRSAIAPDYAGFRTWVEADELARQWATLTT